MERSLKKCVIGIAVLVLAGCASSSQTLESMLAERGLRMGENNSRIPRYQVNGWSLLDQRNLLITAGVKDQYLVQLSAPCFGLNSAFHIGFITPSGVSDRFDSILVRNIGGPPEVCDISDIVALAPI